MNLKTLVVLIALVVVGGAGVYLYMQNGSQPAAPSGAAGINGSPNQGNLGGPDNGTPQQPAGIANPASTNCVVTLGGQLEITNTSAGAVGMCHLKDGRVCEEWALFRDGTCTASTTPSAQ